jgi:hypothetical protein
MARVGDRVGTVDEPVVLRLDPRGERQDRALLEPASRTRPVEANDAAPGSCATGHRGRDAVRPAEVLDAELARLEHLRLLGRRGEAGHELAAVGQDADRVAVAVPGVLRLERRRGGCRASPGPSRTGPRRRTTAPRPARRTGGVVLGRDRRADAAAQRLERGDPAQLAGRPDPRPVQHLVWADRVERRARSRRVSSYSGPLRTFTRAGGRISRPIGLNTSGTTRTK